MSDGSLALQKAIVQALKADSGIASIVGVRAYDDLPSEQKRIADTGAAFPCLGMGTSQILPQIADGGYDGNDEVVTIDGWSRAAGQVEIKRLGAAVNAALDGAALTVDGFRLVELVPEQTQYLRDQDGITHHGVFVFRARLEPV